jgi:hypothetical protein
VPLGTYQLLLALERVQQWIAVLCEDLRPNLLKLRPRALRATNGQMPGAACRIAGKRRIIFAPERN